MKAGLSRRGSQKREIVGASGTGVPCHTQIGTHSSFVNGSMRKHRESQLNDLTSSLDDALFTMSSPAALAVTTLHRVQAAETQFVRDALTEMETTQSSRRLSTAHLLHCALVGTGGQLLFTAVVDAPGKQNLAEVLVDHIEVLDPVWRRCEGYPARGIEDAAGIAEFLAAGCQRNQMICSGYPGATVKEVHKALDWMRKTMHFQIELAKSPKRKN